MRITIQKLIIAIALLFQCSFLGAQVHVPLSGEWHYATDPRSRGLQEEWWKKSFDATIILPGSTDEAGVGDVNPVERLHFDEDEYPNYPDTADFGNFTRIHKYIGKAWYQRNFTLPASQSGTHVMLYLERVLWQSRAWIDGVELSLPCNYLSTPHLHDLGILPKGEHTLTVMVDNSEVLPIFPYGHQYCPAMQTVWNGIVGKIELLLNNEMDITDFQVYPSYKNRCVTIKSCIKNEGGKNEKVRLHYRIRQKEDGKIIKEWETRALIAQANETILQEIKLDSVREWNEFTPSLYEVELEMRNGKQICKERACVGFRDLGSADKHITVNGKKIVVRFSLEGLFSGKQGYPATDRDYWMRVFSLYKSFGFNGIRFHSCTPPEAAFEAADELGLYLQVEFFWINNWTRGKGLIGNENDTLNHFVVSEIENALKVYGNHPSMALVGIGNELAGNFDKMGEWVARWKQQDSRHLYAVGMAHDITLYDDFVEYGARGAVLKNRGTDWDYSRHYIDPAQHAFDKTTFRRKNLPEFTHELGQYVVHPLWSEADEYDGVLRAYNYDYFKSLEKKNGVDGMDYLFQKASGRLNTNDYKAEIEALLRTPYSAGYSLLSMADYPGQGEAMVGWVDALYHLKNFVSVEQYRQYGGAVTPLLRFGKYVWQDGETFKGSVEVANYGNNDLTGLQLYYTVTGLYGEIGHGTLARTHVQQGSLVRIDSFEVGLKSWAKGCKYTINIFSLDHKIANSWNIWVYPASSQSSLGDVLFTSSFEEAMNALKKGRKVLLDASSLGNRKMKKYGSYKSVFWSLSWFKGQQTEVSGAVVQNNHPALSLFETDDVIDWEWQDICEGGHAFVLNDLPRDYRAIVQPVCDFHKGNKLGSIFELRTKEGGRLLVCGYNLSRPDTALPAVRQLKYSLLEYMKSPAFIPACIVDEAWLTKTFSNEALPTVKPSRFKNAVLYIDCGIHFSDKESSSPWEREYDGVILEDGCDYTISNDGVWNDKTGSYWYGAKMKLQIKVKNPELYILKILFGDSNRANRKATVKCEDLPLMKIEEYVPNKWVDFPISREDCMDGIIHVDINSTQGPNAMVQTVVLEKNNE